MKLAAEEAEVVVHGEDAGEVAEAVDDRDAADAEDAHAGDDDVGVFVGGGGVEGCLEDVAEGEDGGVESEAEDADDEVAVRDDADGFGGGGGFVAEDEVADVMVAH